MGRVVRTESAANTSRTGLRLVTVCSRFSVRVASAILAATIVATPNIANGQSGRQKESPNKKPPSQSSGPVAEPQTDRPHTINNSKNLPPKATTEVDPNDVVRISSTLVP